MRQHFEMLNPQWEAAGACYARLAPSSKQIGEL
ncbi:uncharacterized protein G2W53_043816 [Senna tora]|uniref:Uncharacterized protein n=1 Tax=Senna tora TaxID=362788 RepID=A0A834SLU4_9FABA|nr:uncharacterized protein G2W53_043816 [Senna tora]